jgi:hypothetical protein
VVKSPKPYFTDTGLLAHLLKYPDGPTLQNGPMAGALFENLMVTELLKKKFSGEDLFELYYYRDSNDNEIDLVIETARKRLLVEFKMGKTLRTEFAESFRQWDGMGFGVVGGVSAIVAATVSKNQADFRAVLAVFTRVLRSSTRASSRTMSNR